jgi:hypothetical protein
MDVVGHNHISNHHEIVPLPHSFENFDQQIAALAAAQPGLPVITTAGNEMQMIASIVAFEMTGHGGNLAGAS